MEDCTTTVIKIGSEVLDDEERLSDCLEWFAALSQRKILVHGGGRRATQISKKLGIEPVLVDGRRITDAESLDIVTMVYGGLLNKRLVAQLVAFGCRAIGMTGADGDCIRADRRLKGDIDYGFVGDIQSVDVGFFLKLLQNRLVPVMAPLTHDGSGQLLNTNADTIAAQIAMGLAETVPVRLMYVLGLPGLLQNKDDPSSRISTLNPMEFDDLKQQGVISDGMVPKLKNGFDALSSRVDDVWIGDLIGIKKYLEGSSEFGTRLIDGGKYE